MGRFKKCIGVFTLFVFCLAFCCGTAVSQEAAVSVMTLADGTTVSMTPAQLAALATQPGITVSAGVPVVGATQMAVPVPAALGGGFIVGEPAALAAALNAVGVTTGATAVSVAGATAVAGGVVAGASVAGAAAAAGMSAGTMGAIGAGVAVAGGIAAAAGGGGGGGGGSTTTHHH
jgi:hypothetical protein